MISLKGNIKVYPIAITELPIRLPLFESVSAGFPSPAADFAEATLSLDELIIRNPSSTFFVKVVGESMIDAGIYPADILVVDRSLEAKNNDVIIACVDGAFTVKRFIKKTGGCLLKAENPVCESITIDAHSDFQVWGVVLKVIHEPYPLK